MLEGEGDRWDPAGEALLFAAARRDHVNHLIRPLLERGEWVVCDRFTDSTVAYQGYGHGVPLDELARLQRFAIGDFMPDLTLILDLPVEEGLARAARRTGGADRFERLDHAFHERMRAGFQAIAAADPERCIILDAAAATDEMHRSILAAVRGRLGVRLE